MNKGWHIGLAIVVAGVVGVVSYFIHQPILLIAVFSIIAGSIVMIISHYCDKINAFKKRIQSKLLLIIRVFSVIRKLNAFSILQTFKRDDITTIRIQRKFSGCDYGPSDGRDMKNNPESFIFPHLLDVNISPIVTGQNCLLVRCSFFSALPYHLKLENLSIELISPEIPQTKQKIFEYDLTTNKVRVKKSLTLYAENLNEMTQLYIYLRKKSQGKLLEYCKHNTVQACLRLTGFDESHKAYNLETRQTKIAFLDGGELLK